MTTYIESKIITLTSQSATLKRNGSYQSHVWYDMGLFIKDEPDIIHRQITLLNAQIPYSFYVINYTNNTFVFKAQENSLYTIESIPVGNYTGNSLITALTSIFLNAGIVVTITLSSIDGKITINRTNGNDFNISPLSTCQGILGLEKNITYTSTSGSLVFTYPLNLLGIKILQIRSSTLNMVNYSSVHSGITTLLGTIPVSAVPFGMIDYIDKGDSKITFSNNSLDELDIEILDGESGEFINFNNQDWTMTLLVTITRNPDRQRNIFPSQPSLPEVSTPPSQPQINQRPAELPKVSLKQNQNINDLNILTN